MFCANQRTFLSYSWIPAKIKRAKISMSIRRLIVLLCTACCNWVCYLCLKNEAQTKYCLIPVRKVNYISKRRLVSSLLERMPLAFPFGIAHSLCSFNRKLRCPYWARGISFRPDASISIPVTCTDFSCPQDGWGKTGNMDWIGKHGYQNFAFFLIFCN